MSGTIKSFSVYRAIWIGVLIMPLFLGAEVASTDFTGRTVSGATASNITWTTNGIADPGDLTTNAPDGLFDTVDSQGCFAPNRNVDKEGPWSVSIPIKLTVPSIDLAEVVIDYQHFMDSGDIQGAGRLVFWTFTLTGSISGQLDSVSVQGESGQSGTETATFKKPINLTDSESYTLIITAKSRGGDGNNTGLSSLTIKSNIPGGATGTETTMTGTTALLPQDGEKTLILDDFESKRDYWKFSGGAGFYYSKGTSENHARTGSGALLLAGLNADSAATLQEPLSLKTMGAGKLLITFDYKWHESETSDGSFKVEYSLDEGETWEQLGRDFGSKKKSGSSFLSVTKGLTDETLIRFVSEGKSKGVYIDNVIISAEKEAW